MSNTQRTPEQTEQLKKDLLITMRLTKLRAKYNQQNNQPSSTDNQLSSVSKKTPLFKNK